VGIDPSLLFLAKARELATEHPHVTFREGDVRALEFDEGTFDVAFAHTCLTHVPGPDQALRQLFRVLKAGASLACSTAITPAPRSPAATTIRFKAAPTQQWRLWFTIAGWPAGCRR
jgi:ubiquinone/menaquinone biosynthesis C-methylase UbiE